MYHIKIHTAKELFKESLVAALGGRGAGPFFRGSVASAPPYLEEVELSTLDCATITKEQKIAYIHELLSSVKYSDNYE